MFHSLLQTNILLGGLILAVLQLAAALPWLLALDPKWFKRGSKEEGGETFPFQMIWTNVGAPILVGALASLFLVYKGNSTYMQLYGRIYACVLHAQLLVDLFIYLPMGFAWLFPKSGAVAYAAFREGWRQPMFWLITGAGIVGTWVAVVLPYFTFGDDFKMMKQIGFDIVMLSAVLFGVLASSMSISEEIEGRTAITLMSKPVNRRQFLLGKFIGILLACGLMTSILGWNLNWALLAQPEFDQINKDRSLDPMPVEAKEKLTPQLTKLMPSGPARTVAEGIAQWTGETFAYSLYLLWGFGQVMILVAIATALATRLPFVINIVVCLVVYFLGHLAPVVVRVTDRLSDTGSSAVGLVRFLGNLFDTIFPALEFFNMSPAIIRDTPLALWSFAGYVLTVFGYSVIYTLIALLVGLLMFEDRDLA